MDFSAFSDLKFILLPLSSAVKNVVSSTKMVSLDECKRLWMGGEVSEKFFTHSRSHQTPCLLFEKNAHGELKLSRREGLRLKMAKGAMRA